MNTNAITTQNNDHAVERPRSWAAPAVDVFENDDEILLVADLPGVRQDDVEIQFADGELKLNASKALPDFDFDYRRLFGVSTPIDPERITAKLDNGVLTVHLPKSESAKPRRIPVSAA